MYKREDFEIKVVKSINNQDKQRTLELKYRLEELKQIINSIKKGKFDI
jgi:hypothetical protein